MPPSAARAAGTGAAPYEHGGSQHGVPGCASICLSQSLQPAASHKRGTRLLYFPCPLRCAQSSQAINVLRNTHQPPPSPHVLCRRCPCRSGVSPLKPPLLQHRLSAPARQSAWWPWLTWARRRTMAPWGEMGRWGRASTRQVGTHTHTLCAHGVWVCGCATASVINTGSVAMCGGRGAGCHQGHCWQPRHPTPWHPHDTTCAYSPCQPCVHPACHSLANPPANFVGDTPLLHSPTLTCVLRH